MRVHFIAIGGSAMHNLAIALHLKGDDVSGSDDEIFEPSRGRLNKYGILPGKMGWDSGRITMDLDAVILGMHAKEDNPELQRAKDLGLKIYSFPEYLYEQSKNKKRVVIGGSHGKTTVTAIILHVLKFYGMDSDYMVGAKLDDFEVMVKISDTAPVMILEGDEYLTSALDRRPKFHVYMPDIALVTGIAWDHINVFPTFENYVEQFRIFLDLIPDEGVLVYFDEDENLKKLVENSQKGFKKVPYAYPPYVVGSENIKAKAKVEVEVEIEGERYPVQIFGAHNMANLLGAMRVCEELGISNKDFMKAIASFKGAANRLEMVDQNEQTIIFKDFAHAPSKLKATTDAAKKRYPHRMLVACMALHTYSSLNKKFLPHYKGCMDSADHPFVYFNPHAIKLKRLSDLSIEDVKRAFNNPRLRVFNDSSELKEELLKIDWKGKNLLMMSSGDFGGIELGELAGEVLAKY